MAGSVMFWRRKYRASLASGHGEDNWVAGEMAEVVTDVVVTNMSDLMKRETDY